MPCPSEDVRIDPRLAFAWDNWQRSAPTQVERYWEPTSLPEIVNIVQQAESAGKKLHVRGGGFSLNDCAAGQEWMMDLQHLNRVLDGVVTGSSSRNILTSAWSRRLSGSGRRLVHVEAGIRLHDLCQRLTPVAPVQQIAVHKKTLFARCNESRLYTGHIFGRDLSLSGHANGLTAMCVHRSALLGVTSGNLLIQRLVAPNDINWDVVGPTPAGLIGMVSKNNVLFAIDRNGGLFSFNVNNSRWARIDTAPNMAALAVSGDELFAISRDGRLFQRPVTTGIAPWTDIGLGVPEVTDMTAAEGWLLAISGQRNLWQRRIRGNDTSWSLRADMTRPDADMAIPTLGGFLGQTLAGAVKTSTHGSDLYLPPLPDYVQALHLVTSGGQEVWLERETRPLTRDDAALRRALSACPDLRILRDDRTFEAAVVDMGRFGIVYSMVFEARPKLFLSEFTQKVRWRDVRAALNAGKTRVRQITWETIAPAGNMRLLAGNTQRIFAIDSSDNLFERPASDGDEDWRDIGTAPGIITMTASETALFAVNRAGRLLHRLIRSTRSSWTDIGPAERITSLSVAGRWLIATRSDGVSCRRSNRLQDEVWIIQGEASDVVSMCNRGGTLFGLKSNGYIMTRAALSGFSSWNVVGNSGGMTQLVCCGKRLFGLSRRNQLCEATVNADPFDNIYALLQRPPTRLAIQGNWLNHRYFDLVISTRDNVNCYIRRRWEARTTPVPEAINMSDKLDFFYPIAIFPNLRDAIRALAESLPMVVEGTLTAAQFASELSPLPPEIKFLVIGIMEIFKTTERVDTTIAAAELRSIADQEDATLGDALSVALNMLKRNELTGAIEQIFGAVNTFANDQVESEILPGNAEQMGRQGLNWAVSAGLTDPVHYGKIYKGESIEVMFPTSNTKYVTFVDTVMSRMLKINQAGYVAVRFSRRSDATLSMLNMESDMVCSVEITSLAGLDGNDDWYRWLLSQALAQGGRPHWGQYNTGYDARRVAADYAGGIAEWRNALTSLTGTADTFSNEFTRRMGLEPRRRAVGGDVIRR